MKSVRGITLISLVITIIVLIILSSVGIYLSLGENGIFTKAEYAKNETTKQTATEKMNLKITNMQMETYAEEQRMPTLQEFADGLCVDNEIEYVELESKNLAALDKIEVGDANSIFTKLKEYPYEFEIDSSLRLASIDGIQVATNNTNSFTMHSPILLTTASMPNGTKNAGTYKASSSYYTKTDTEVMTNYLSFTQDEGWTIEKSGLYYLGGYINHNYSGTNGSVSARIRINDVIIAPAFIQRYISSANTVSQDSSNSTIYLSKGDVLDFEFYAGVKGDANTAATFTIYAMFE